ncbi:hypothetical protein ZIOFF_029929 [Zingiber officinale]|uniref:ATP-dependent DNA helicase n=1 Tax=Zingiber officinale TaxID=94328 RepID=A0A8J5GXD5_ZINOF|nr:hypothetical protein ZIOFF_029929 [Zingiber officinale]
MNRRVLSLLPSLLSLARAPPSFNGWRFTPDRGIEWNENSCSRVTHPQPLSLLSHRGGLAVHCRPKSRRKQRYRSRPLGARVLFPSSVLLVQKIVFFSLVIPIFGPSPQQMKKSVLPVKSIKGSGSQNLRKEDLENLLSYHFGYSGFRGKQLEAIDAVLSGKDCFCLMPTGGGKSLCYQIPAVAKSGIVLVICPLIALMENQVEFLRKKGISAEFLSSTLAADAKQKIHEDLNSGKPSVRLLYVTPELVATVGFMTKLKKLYERGLLSLVAVDEAHCISSWGHDFRPSYRKLSSLRIHLPEVPILALTATAASQVEKDVIESLCLRQPLVLRASFNRPNIFYEVRYKDLLDDSYADLSNLLKSNRNACSIIYCLERASCDDLSSYLSKNGISSAVYHAGLSSKLRTSVLGDWLSSKVQGIDRKDVRIVCHFNIPKSMESFYQESGRAGRDRLSSRSILYYGLDDRKKMEFILRTATMKKRESSSPSSGLPEKSLAAFTQMVEYCEGSGCRRGKILQSFGEQVSTSLCQKSCDSCKQPSIVAQHLKDLEGKTYSQKAKIFPILTKRLDFEACADFLEMECFKKYGKVGKTFYNSQVAATIRWLSHSSMEQIQDKFRDISAQTCSSSGRDKFSLDGDSHLIQEATTGKATDDQVQDNAFVDFPELVEMEGPGERIDLPPIPEMKGPGERIDLPPIPSFSEFVRKKGKEHSSGSAIVRTSDAGKHASKNKEKRIRLQ